MSPIDEFTLNLNYYTYLINIINGAVAFFLVFLWCVTKEGSRAKWTKLRLLISSSMLFSILLTIACVIFTTYFDDLIQLKAWRFHIVARLFYFSFPIWFKQVPKFLPQQIVHSQMGNSFLNTNLSLQRPLLHFLNLHGYRRIVVTLLPTTQRWETLQVEC